MNDRKKTRVVGENGGADGNGPTRAVVPKTVESDNINDRRTRVVGLAGADGPKSGANSTSTDDRSFDRMIDSTRVHQPETAEEQEGPMVGWLVVIEGAGRGRSRCIYNGVNQIGRDPSQRIAINFGDDSISRQDHAYLAYDDESRTFHLNHGGKANLVRVNDKPVLGQLEIVTGDEIRLGRTKLKFVAFCGSDFDWNDSDKSA